MHPLRTICEKKMLCSCNNHPPRERSPKKSLSPKSQKKRSIPVIGGVSIHNLEAQETAAVGSLLNKVEWKNTPVYN